MSPWGWQPKRDAGIWRHGAPMLRPFVAAAPWLTVLLLVVMLFFLSRTLTSANGVLLDLPASDVGAGEATDLVALVMPMDRETLVFFDDARYRLDDPDSARVLVDHLATRVSRTEGKTLLALVDRRVPTGEIMAFSALAKRGGVTRLLFAEKQSENAE